MKLLVDIGNTCIKAVLVAKDQFSVIPYHHDLLVQHPITQLSIASVRHEQQASAIIEAAKQAAVNVVEAKTSAYAFGVSCAYEKFETLGIDRWLAVLGAVAHYPDQHLIIVDAGTATTVDFVSADRVHLGGWIIPGLDLMTQSIAAKADKVFDDPKVDFRHDIGRSTPEALKYGCLAAQVGIVQQAVTVFGRSATLVIAGGNAERLKIPLTAYQPWHEPLLVFKGLDLF